MAETQIEWTDATWNPVAGCSVVTAGCTHCYAMEMAKRLEAMGVEKYTGLARRSGKRTVWNSVGMVEKQYEWLTAPRSKSIRGASIKFCENISISIWVFLTLCGGRDPNAPITL